MQDAVSCVIPTHGRIAHLRTAVDSVLAQTTPPAEVIIVDDLDDPETRDTVNGMSSRSPVPVRLAVNMEHPGASGSRNKGAALASGAWIAFLDDDDAWAPAYLASALARTGPGVDAVITGQKRFRTDGATQAIVPPGPEALGEVVHRRNPGMTGSNLIIRASRFHTLGGFDPGLPCFNDWDLLIRLHAASVPYVVEPSLLTEWREHTGERISTPSVRRARGIERFVRKHRAVLPPATRLELTATALSIRRRNPAPPAERLHILQQSVLTRIARGVYAAAGQV